MAGELGYDPGTGQLVFSPATGQLAKDCAVAAAWKLTPCYERSAIPCDFCDPGETPKFITVILSGVDADLCPCSNFMSGSEEYLSLAIDGTYVLPQTSSCIWRLTGQGSFSQRQYSGLGCEGDFVPFIGTLVVEVRLRASGWTANASPLDPPIAARAFGSGFVSAACGAEWEADNILFCQDDFTDTGHAVVTPGDINSRCPGGDPYYTDTDLTANDGEVVNISEDPGICYQVAANTDEDVADGTATVTNCWTTCAKCCDEDAEDC